MSGKIVVIGSMNTDMVISSERLPLPGETVVGGNFMMNSGGKGANQAVAAARLDGDVYIIAKSGNDLFGRRAIEQFQQDHINTDYMCSDPDLPSGVALILVDANGENSIAVASGANASLSPADIDAAASLIAESKIVLMQLETPIETIEHAAHLAHLQGKKVILNPAPARPLSDKLMADIDILIPNKNEAELLSGIEINGIDDARRAAQAIGKRGINTVIITLGSDGALVMEGEDFHLVSARKVKVVDTTAAGDTFCGALAVALTEDRGIVEAVEFASRCAAITVTRPGAQMSLPRRCEIID
ncbi:MAG: ribokinase [Muribaculaceae bacterium]|nr:ribokinase [Muribaculaceae bacterium]